MFKFYICAVVGKIIEWLWNNLSKRFKLCGPCKLHSAKSLEGTLLCNTCSQKRKHNKSLTYTWLVGPILECGSACWGPCREWEINELDWVQKKAAQFANHTKDSDWETLAQRRMIVRYAHFLKRTVGNGLGKLYTTGCDRLTIWVGLIMFEKLGAGNKERISGNIPL